MALTDTILARLLRRNGLDQASAAEVMRRLAVAGGTADAADVPYDHTESGLAATTVQQGIDELLDRVAAAEAAATALAARVTALEGG